jgi:Protein of unknown function (DUF3592)
MRLTINANSRVTTRAVRGPGILGAALLVAALIFLLSLRIGFARYAFTAFLWKHANGTVVSLRSTTNPTIQFAANDGPHAFSEDYFLLCGRRSLCFRRTFTPGEVVPVVYDPDAPNRAYVYDWALFATIVEWCIEAGILLVLLLGLAGFFRGGSSSTSIRIGPDPE